MQRLSVRAFLLLGVLFLAIPHASADSELLRLGRELLDEGQFEKAVLPLTTALERDGDNPLLRYLLGRAYYEQRNFDQAIKQLERAVKGEMRNSMYHLWLGRAYGRKAERSSWFSALSLAGKVRREFETAVQLDPQNLAARSDLLEFYLDAPGFLGGGHDKARAGAEEIAKRDPIEGHRAWASYWADQKQYDKVEVELRKAVEAKPRRPDAYFDLAEFYRGRGRFAEMEPVMQMAIERHASDRRAPYFTAVSYIVNHKQLDEAQQLLEKYIAGPVGAEDPSRAQARVWLGRLFEKRKQLPKAEEEYGKALKLEPDMKEAKEALRQLRKKK